MSADLADACVSPPERGGTQGGTPRGSTHKLGNPGREAHGSYQPILTRSGNESEKSKDGNSVSSSTASPPETGATISAPPSGGARADRPGPDGLSMKRTAVVTAEMEGQDAPTMTGPPARGAGPAHLRSQGSSDSSTHEYGVSRLENCAVVTAGRRGQDASTLTTT